MKSKAKLMPACTCEIGECSEPGEYTIRDFVLRKSIRYNIPFLEQYGEKHFYCKSHVRGSRTFLGHEKQVADNETDYYWDQIRSAYMTKPVQRHMKKKIRAERVRMEKKESMGGMRDMRGMREGRA